MRENIAEEVAYAREHGGSPPFTLEACQALAVLLKNYSSEHPSADEARLWAAALEGRFDG